jgi:toxin ParE1/3/4
MIVSLSESAQLDRMHLWLDSAERFGIERADDFIARIDTTIRETIGTFPNAGRQRVELGAGIRSFPILPYVLFYRVHARRVEIVRLLHGRRDIKAPIVSLLIA